MPTQDTTHIKDKIISIINRKGPSLPVHVTSETDLSMLFASAFLSELLSEKRLKISNMRVGNSPLYYIEGQESKLETFAHHLKSKEKEAFQLLKDNSVLTDADQLPAIRVALRAIKDFAIPFKKQDQIFWRYFTVPESKIKINFKEVSKQEVSKPQKEQKIEEINEKPLNIFTKEEPKQKKIAKKTPSKRKTTASQKKNERFFNKIKEFLNSNSIEILDIESFNKNDLVLRVKDKNQEKLLIAYNKKRITDADIIKSHHKAEEANIPYIILSLGEPLKKLTNMIEAIKNLSYIKKVE